VQHLGGSGSSLVDILRRHSPLPVQWIADHDTLRPGCVYVCPPQHLLEVMPDAECSVRPMEPDHRLRPIDFFLASLADSYGPRAMVVVLTGMGRDAAAGSEAVSQAGGTVLVQSPESAEHAIMPSAVIGTGVADMVLPLPELGRVIADVVAGDALPRTLSERAAAERLFAGTGEVPALLRETDWARTPFGPVGQWPGSLRTVIRIVLDSPLAMCLHDALFPITRYGALENAWFNLSYLPVRDDAGQVTGTLCVVMETTAEVLSRRRLDTLHALSTTTSGSATRKEAFERTLKTLGGNDQDIPFAVGYYLDVQAGRAQLAGTAGMPPGNPMAPLPGQDRVLRQHRPRVPHPADAAALAAGRAGPPSGGDPGRSRGRDGCGGAERPPAAEPGGHPPGFLPA
jgi:hypothetical protein